MPNKLPKGWVKTTLGAILPLRYGKARSEYHGEPRENTAVFGSSGVIGQFNRALTSGPTLIVGRKGTVGSVYYSQSPCWPIDTVYFSEATPDLNLHFFKYLLELLDLKGLDRSTAVPGLSRNDFNALEVRIPPLKEQERIVVKLDALLSRVAAGEAAARHALDRLQRYRAAILHAAVTGELTAEWRKTHSPKETGAQLLERLLQERRVRWEAIEFKRLCTVGKPPQDDRWKNRYIEPKQPNRNNLGVVPEIWTWACIEQLGEVQLGRQRSPKNVSNHFPTKYIRAANITEKGLDLSDVFEMEFKLSERDRYALRHGDIILSEASGSASQVGKPAIWRDELPLCCFQNTVIRLRPIC